MTASPFADWLPNGGAVLDELRRLGLAARVSQNVSFNCVMPRLSASLPRAGAVSAALALLASTTSAFSAAASANRRSASASCCARNSNRSSSKASAARL